MSILLHAMLLTSLLSSGSAEAPATEIRYNGTLTPVAEGATTKQFDVYCLLVNREGGRELAFLVDEAGGGGWPWPERFGIIELDQPNKEAGRKQIRLLHTHDGGQHPVNVRTPVFEFGDKLKAGAAWQEGKHSYEVVRSRKIKDRDCWVVEVSTNFGHEQTLLVDKQSHLIVSAEQRVFIGQGDRYALKLELESARPLDEKTLDTLRKPLQTIARLKETLNRAENQQAKPELSDAQLEAASAVIEQLTAEAAKTPFERYATIIRRDVAAQQQRATDVGGLAKKFVGSKAPELALKTLAGKQLEQKDYAGKIVVLHFWEYQGKPLVEPYGQVGYLDFLNNKNNKRKLDVVTFGVAVDKRLADPSERTAALRSVRQLQEFFNLGYPLLLDDGSLLAKFGDPRRLDASLPLWVIIGADGKVAHYSTGFFDIKPDEGLKQLEAVIVDLVKQQRDDPE